MPTRPPSFSGKTKPSAWQHTKTAAQRGYGSEHRRLRKQVLAEELLCRECTAINRVSASVTADHIKPLSRGGRTERSNMQGLCKMHHDAKTAREAAEGAARTR